MTKVANNKTAEPVTGVYSIKKRQSFRYAVLTISENTMVIEPTDKTVMAGQSTRHQSNTVTC